MEKEQDAKSLRKRLAERYRQPPQKNLIVLRGQGSATVYACRKILPYLDGGIDEAGNIDYGIITVWDSGPRTLNCSTKEIVVTNFYCTIHDAWERDIKYVSRPPYESYTLSSAGPDGRFGTDDDIVAGVE